MSVSDLVRWGGFGHDVDGDLLELVEGALDDFVLADSLQE